LKTYNNYLSTRFHALGKLSGAGVFLSFLAYLAFSHFWGNSAGWLFSLSLLLLVTYSISVTPFFFYTWTRYSPVLVMVAVVADFVMAQALGTVALFGIITKILNRSG
jgi:hypothetical protein